MTGMGQSVHRETRARTPRGVMATAILIYIYCGVRIISLLVGLIHAILFRLEIDVMTIVINLVWTAAFLATGADVQRCRKGGLLWGIILSLVIMTATVVFSVVLGFDPVNLAMIPLLTATLVLLIVYRKKYTLPNKPLGAYFKGGKAREVKG